MNKAWLDFFSLELRFLLDDAEEIFFDEDGEPAGNSIDRITAEEICKAVFEAGQKAGGSNERSQ